MNDIGFFETKGSTKNAIGTAIIGISTIGEGNYEDYLDLAIENGDLKVDNGLETAVMISLYTDRFVPTEELPRNETDRKGWWGDQISEFVEDRIGSRLWAVQREGVSRATVVKIEDAVKEALQWMIDDGVAESVTVSGSIISSSEIDFLAEIVRPKGDNIPFRFVWDGQALKLQSEFPVTPQTNLVGSAIIGTAVLG